MVPHCRFGRLLLALLKAESDRCVVFRTMPRLILALCLLLAAAAPAAQPNFIFILADDMGYGDPEFAGGLARTPHLNRLADEGLRFTDAHTTSAVCTPTRYGIVTGRYNWRSPLKSGVLWGESEPLIPTSRFGLRVTVAPGQRRIAERTAFRCIRPISKRWRLSAAN